MTKEYIFTIEGHSTLKTVVTPLWEKMRTGPEQFGPAGWGWRARPENLDPVRLLNPTFLTFTVVKFSLSVDQEHLRSIGNVYSLIMTKLIKLHTIKSKTRNYSYYCGWLGSLDAPSTITSRSSQRIGRTPLITTILNKNICGTAATTERNGMFDSWLRPEYLISNSFIEFQYSLTFNFSTFNTDDSY